MFINVVLFSAIVYAKTVPKTTKQDGKRIEADKLSASEMVSIVTRMGVVLHHGRTTKVFWNTWVSS
jgi:hypothetical protein